VRGARRAARFGPLGADQGVSPRPSPKERDPAHFVAARARGAPIFALAGVWHRQRSGHSNSKRRRRGGDGRNMSGVSGRIHKEAFP